MCRFEEGNGVVGLSRLEVARSATWALGVLRHTGLMCLLALNSFYNLRVRTLKEEKGRVLNLLSCERNTVGLGLYGSVC